MKKIIFGVLTVFLLFSCKGKPNNILEGNKIPPFEMTDTKGVTFNSQNLQGKYTLLIFFATWCPSCNTELPEMQKIYDEYGEFENFELLAVGREQDSKTLDDFWEENKYTFPVFPDENREIYSLFAESGIPRVYWIDSTGVVLHAAVGFDEQEMQGLKDEIAKIIK